MATINVPVSEKLLLSPAEAAALIGSSQAFILRAIQNGRLKTVDLDGVQKIRPDELKRYIKTL